MWDTKGCDGERVDVMSEYAYCSDIHMQTCVVYITTLGLQVRVIVWINVATGLTIDGMIIQSKVEKKNSLNKSEV